MSPRLTALLARVFQVPAASLSTESGPHSIAKWDSAGHLNLVLELEKEFGVTLEDDEVMEMVSAEAVEDALRRHGAEL